MPKNGSIPTKSRPAKSVLKTCGVTHSDDKIISYSGAVVVMISVSRQEMTKHPLERKYGIIFMETVHFHVREDNRTVKMLYALS